MHVEVTLADRVTGCRRQPLCCPVALACNRASGLLWPLPPGLGWRADLVVLTSPGGFAVPTPAAVAAWMDVYDFADDLAAVPGLAFEVEEAI